MFVVLFSNEEEVIIRAFDADHKSVECTIKRKIYEDAIKSNVFAYASVRDLIFMSCIVFSNKTNKFTKHRYLTLDIANKFHETKICKANTKQKSMRLDSLSNISNICTEIDTNRVDSVNQEPVRTTVPKNRKGIEQSKAEMVASFYGSIYQVGGDPSSFDLDMTLRDMIEKLAQNGIRFTVKEKND